MAVADAFSISPVGDGVHEVVGHEHDPGLVHGDVRPLALAGT